MLEQSVADARPSLSERLQDVTEQLAAARGQQDVFKIVLKPALEALSAIAGAVLLVNEKGDRLEIAATQGYEEGAQTIWQDGPISGNVPAGDALEKREPLFFGHQGDLLRAYPELEERTGAVAPVASAVLPVFEGEKKVGAIVLDFKEPHDFTEEENRFLRILSAQCAIALGRARLSQNLEARIKARTAELEERTAALDAFAAFTEAVGSQTDVLALARQAGKVLRATLGQLSVAYYELEGDVWRVRAWSEDLAPDLVAQLQAGIPASAPNFAAAVRGNGPLFVDGWDAEREHVPQAQAYGAVALYPYFAHGRPRGLFTVGTQDARAWSEREKSLVRAVGRGLQLALERAESVAESEARARRAEEEARAQEAFVTFTEAVGSETNVLALARQAVAAVRANLAHVSVAYYELEDGPSGDKLWKARAWSEDVAPEVVAQMLSGVPREAPNFAEAARSRSGVFAEGWDAATDSLPSAAVYGAAAFLPVFVEGATRGMFAVGTQGARVWAEREKSVVRAVARGLELAFERAGAAVRLAAQNAELEARTKALEGFADLTRDLALEHDPLTLMGRAQDLAVSLLPASVSTYYELDGDTWRLRSHRGEFRHPALLAALERGLPRGATVNVDAAFDRRQPYWQDRHDPDTVSAAREEIAAIRASVAFPVFTWDRVRGVLAVGLQDARPWTEVERVLLETVMHSLALALERADAAQHLKTQNAELDARTKALEGFADLTRDLGAETDAYALVRRAQELAMTLIPHGFAVYYEPEAELWRLKSQLGSLGNPELQAVLDAGISYEGTPNLLIPWTSRAPYYQDAYDREADGLASVTQTLQTTATVPVLVQGEPRGVFAFGLNTARPWSRADKAVLESIARSLGLAIERADAAQHLKAQNAELDARTKALAGFSNLTRDLSVETDRLVLVRRAQEVVMSLLPEGYALYYEREGDLWRNKVQVGGVGDPDLQAFIDAGPPVGVTPSVDVPWATRRALYQDTYARGSDTPPEMVGHVGAAASLPVLRNGEPVGVFIAVLFGHREWTNTDKAVLNTVVHSLGLALERAEALRELDRTRHYLNVVAENAPLLLFATDARGIYTLSQGSLLSKLGLKSGQAVGHSATAMFAHEPDLREGLRLNRALSGEPAHDLMYFDSRGVVFETWFTPVKNAAGEVTEVVGVSLDVTERLEGQRAIERANAELRRSNAELEQFAYVASHDLQAPIRAVTSFADVIARKYGETLDERGRTYLGQIVQSGQHMKRLVDDLLMFSRLHTEQREVAPTDSGAVLDVVLRRLTPEIEAAGGEVTRGDLPTVMADAPQLDQLWQNLVTNGLKYAREGVPPRVRVSAERDGDFWRFAVADNGIGIEAQYFERIFVIFQRLHSRDQFEGTGIGLAVCKKIVERHGGQLWLESTPGEGTTFFFTLPGIQGRKQAPHSEQLPRIFADGATAKSPSERGE